MSTENTENSEFEEEVLAADDMRESLTAAFDESVAGEGDGESEGEKPAAAAEGEKSVEGEKPVAPAEGEKPAAEEATAPASWSPTAREEWAKVPKSVQETISKREKEITTAMQESANARQQMASFSDMVKPFQGMFASQGVQNPMQGVYNVLQTTAQLQGGTPQNKAAAMAGLVKQFNVSIKDLDDALVGNVQAEQQAPTDARYDKLENEFKALQSRFHGQDQAEQAQINAETQTFLKETPFASDVRTVMADFMDLASKAGQKLTLKESYDRAIATRPDIQAILANRAKAESSTAHLNKSRAAGVIVPINSEGGGAAPKPTSLREALDAAWDEG